MYIYIYIYSYTGCIYMYMCIHKCIYMYKYVGAMFVSAAPNRQGQPARRELDLSLSFR